MKQRLLSMHMTPYGIIYVHHVALNIISPHFQLTQAVKQSMTPYHKIKRFIYCVGRTPDVTNMANLSTWTFYNATMPRVKYKCIFFFSHLVRRGPGWVAVKI